MRFYNILHNVLNVLIALIAGLETIDWTPFVEPALALKIVGILSILKLVMNVSRDGMTGLVAYQPPVEKL